MNFKKMGKMIITITGGIAFLLLLLLTYIYFTTPKLPEKTNQTIEDLQNSELPELVKGKTGFVTSGGYRIWYELISPPGKTKGTILLFSGMGTDALLWPPSFIERFTRAGYQVLRFDYRDTGMSDWQNRDLKKEVPYTLDDLAEDAKLILDHLNINRVHIAGLSMGGMVTQKFVLRYPALVESICILSSSGNIRDETLPQVSGKFFLQSIKIGIKYGLFPSEANLVKMMVATKTLLRGKATYQIDIETTAIMTLYNMQKRKGFNPDASKAHNAATGQTDFSWDTLKTINKPALIIHGVEDPLVPIEHGKKLASIIPGSKSLWLENLGHDIPTAAIDSIADAIIENMENR